MLNEQLKKDNLETSAKNLTNLITACTNVSKELMDKKLSGIELSENEKKLVKCTADMGISLFLGTILSGGCQCPRN